MKYLLIILIFAAGVGVGFYLDRAEREVFADVIREAEQRCTDPGGIGGIWYFASSNVENIPTWWWCDTTPETPQLFDYYETK